MSACLPNFRFFLGEADAWRNETWAIMHQRPDVGFFFVNQAPRTSKRLFAAKLG